MNQLLVLHNCTTRDVGCRWLHGELFGTYEQDARDLGSGDMSYYSVTLEEAATTCEWHEEQHPRRPGPPASDLRQRRGQARGAAPVTAPTYGQRFAAAAWTGARSDAREAATAQTSGQRPAAAARSNACDESELEGDRQESSVANGFA